MVTRETLNNYTHLWLREKTKVKEGARRNVEYIARVPDTEIRFLSKPRRARPCARR